jgi:hypothetical protein
MHSLAWLGLALVAYHRGVTKANALRDLAKRQFELRDVRQGHSKQSKITRFREKEGSIVFQ